MSERDTPAARGRGGLPQPAPSPSAPPAPCDIDWWSMLVDPEFLASPYGELRRLREIAPVHRDPESGVFFVLSHDAFRQMSTSPAMGRDTRFWSTGWNRAEVRETDPLTFTLFSDFQPQMTNANPPDHRRMRAVYEKAFRRSDLAELHPMMEAACRRLVDALPRDAPFDFMESFAQPFARNVAFRAFSIPPDMHDQVVAWNAALAPIANIFMTVEQKRHALEALHAFRDWLRDGPLAADSPHDNGDDGGFLALARAAAASGTMDESENLNNLVTLIAGGTATASLLGNGLLCLLRHPDQFARLRADRTLMKTAIEEMLRFEPGCSFIIRVAIEDFDCAGTTIPAGALAIGLVPATSRDPARFEAPDTFDIARRANPHHVFGAGAHICIGKAMVRMMAETAFNTLMDRYAHIELAGEPVWWAHRSDQHGLHTLPLRLVDRPSHLSPTVAYAGLHPTYSNGSIS